MIRNGPGPGIALFGRSLEKNTARHLFLLYRERAGRA
jgi:hypothetical protein